MNEIPGKPMNGVWIVVSDFADESRIVALCSSAAEAEDFCTQHSDTLADLAYTYFPFGFRATTQTHRF